MIGKITTVVAAALLLGSAGVASAQTDTKATHNAKVWSAPYADSYYNQDYWRAIAPQPFAQRDPYVGTLWEGVAPY